MDFKTDKHIDLITCNKFLKAIGKSNERYKFLVGVIEFYFTGKKYLYEVEKTTSASYCSKVVNSYFKNTEYEYLLSEYKDYDILNKGDVKYINKEYLEKKLKCYSYDINSAYAFACCKKLPTKLIRMFDWVKDNEIGFNFKGEPHLTGQYCHYIFKLEEIPPLIKFANEIYQKKKNAKDKQERRKYKDILNIAIGCFAKKNKFIRNTIIFNSMNYVESLRDENSILTNIDSIVSLKERKDLPIGDELGQFKLDHNNEDFYMTNVAYQWGKEKPKYAGMRLNDKGNDLSKGILNIKNDLGYTIIDKGAYYEIKT